MTKPTVTQLMAAFRPALAGIGFKKRSGQIFTLQLDDQQPGCIGWLGLNVTSTGFGEYVRVVPLIGVHHNRVESIVAALRGERSHAYLPVTVAKPLDRIVDNELFAVWLLQRESLQSGAADLADAISEFGCSFMKSYCQLDAIAKWLDDVQNPQHQFPFQAPVAWLLAGNVEKAKASVSRALRSYEGKQGPLYEQYRTFASNLSQEMSSILQLGSITQCELETMAPSWLEAGSPIVAAARGAGYLAGGGARFIVQGDAAASFTKSALLDALYAFGEEGIERRVRDGLTDHEVERIGAIAAQKVAMSDPQRSDGSGYAFDYALALAAIEVLEGAGRPPLRKRRRRRATK